MGYLARAHQKPLFQERIMPCNTGLQCLAEGIIDVIAARPDNPHRKKEGKIAFLLLPPAV